MMYEFSRKQTVTPDRWQQIDQVWERALEREPEQRRTFLDEACAGDQELLSEVEALLEYEYDNEGHRFQERAAMQMTADRPASTPSLVGEHVGHYQILSLLGAGGMGEVYKARDTRLNRMVSIKVLPSHLSERIDLRKRFELEAKAASALNHPNIVTVHDIITETGRDFIVMEYVQGKTLDKLIPRRGMKLHEVFKYAVQIADALAKTHAVGIIHRDLKPGNIMVGDGGTVKVLDFGLAKLAGPSAGNLDAATHTIVQPTQEGIVGTVSYMSPEQAAGKPVDTRSDIFSFGSVLYEMVTGQRAFQGDSMMSTLAAILNGEPKSAREIARSLPDDLDRIIIRCLRKEPGCRFQHMEDLKAALQDLKVIKKPVEKDRNGRYRSAEHLFKDLRHASKTSPVQSVTVRRRAAWIGTGLLLALMATVLWQLWGGGISGSSPAGMVMTQLTHEGKARDAAISPDGRSFAYVLIEPGQQSLWVKQISTGSSLQLIGPADVRYMAPTFSNDGNFVYLVRRERNNPSRELYRIPSLGGMPEKIAVAVNSPITFSPDGGRFAFIREGTNGESQLIIANRDGSNQNVLASRKLPELFSIEGLAWSPDGESIMCAARSFAQGKAGFGLLVVRLKDGAERLLTDHRWTSIRRFAWLPNGQGLFIVATSSPSPLRHQVHYVSYPDGKERSITHDLNDYRSMSVSANGETLLTVQVHHFANIWVGPADNATLSKQISFGVGAYDGSNGISWTADGRIVYVSNVSGTRKIWIMNQNGGHPRQLSRGPGEDLNPHVSPNGLHIVYDSDRAGARNIWRMDTDGENPRRLTWGDREEDPRISPDGKWIVYTSIQSGKVSLWRTPIDGGQQTQLTREHSEFAVISPDGRQIASSLQNDQTNSLIKIALFPFEGGTPLRVFDIETPAERLVRWSANGTALTYVRTRNGISTLLSQPLTGKPAQVIADFERDRIFSFDWSPDGKKLAVSRGIIQYDVVQVSKFY